MLFPNFYVSSVVLKMSRFVGRTRMSLSYLAAWKQNRRCFHAVLMWRKAHEAGNRSALPSGAAPAAVIPFIFPPGQSNFLP
jgi:hypothetical protein